MNCCRHKYFVIYRGDDTDFPGNQELIVELNTTLDLTGCSAHFSFQGFTQDFDEIPSDKKLRLVIPNSATGKFALGAADAKLWLTNGTKVRTVENRIHIVVTNRVDEAYNNDDPQAITVTISATVVLDDTVTAESTNGVKSSGIWSWVKSLLPSWLTAESEEPRGKTDFDAGTVENWTFTGSDAPTFPNPRVVWSGNALDDVAPFRILNGEETYAFTDSLHKKTETRLSDWIKIDPYTELDIVATRSDKTYKLTRTANLAAGGLAKFGADGVLVQATEGVDYLKTHQDISGKQDKILETGVLKGGGAGAILPAIPSSSAGELSDYRDPKDAKCYESVDLWTWEFSDGLTHELPDPVWDDESPVSHWTVGGDVPESPEAYDENATSLRFIAGQTWPKDYSATATRTRVASKGHTFVTADIAARSLECGEGDAKQTVTVENGVAKLDDFFGESNSALVETIKEKSRIDDIDSIRAGAALGATALQYVPDLDASKITSLTGFSEGQTGDLATTDSLNVALSKLQTMAKAGGGGGASLWGCKLTVRFDGDTSYIDGIDSSKTEIIVVKKDGTVQVSNDPNASNVFDDVFAASIEVRGTHGGGVHILPSGYRGGSEAAVGYVSKQWMVLTGDTDVTVSGWTKCLTGDTMVAMADGSERRIDTLHAGDRVLAYDAETNEIVADELVFSDADEVKTHDVTDVWTFEGGFKVKTVHDHELYNVERGGMKYMSEWKIGEHAITIGGRAVALVGHRQEHGEVRHFKITGHHHNFFVNGLLNGDRYSRVHIKIGGAS